MKKIDPFQKIMLSNPLIRESFEFDKKLLEMNLIESGEKFVSLTSVFQQENVKVLFRNDRQPRIFFTRNSVAYSLVKAAHIVLEKGYVLKIEDAYRSIKRQQVRFMQRLEEVKNTYPDIGKDDLAKIANIYTAGIPILAAHTAGAAVDVSLVTSSLESVDFGSEYPVADIKATTAYPHISEKAKKNRLLLKKVMEAAGFVNYPFEYWHFSIGDVCAAYIKQESIAKYAPVEFDSQSLHFKTLPPKIYYSFFV